MSFSAQRLDGEPNLDGKSEFGVVGTVTLLGQEHPLELATTAEIHDGLVDATITFPVPYVDWDLRNPSMMMLRVAKVVDVTVHVTGRFDVVVEAGATN